ncbi:hypothetical protein CASFOL_041086 [Castilleja foliolosa]|uniref:Retrotransposon gag domain-containing protein n=1 Tax=Castilleja foliolosa TaxID=1961234 RepID=A0ABD3BDH7_9LAMI
MPPLRQTRAAPLGADDGDLAELLRENAEYRRVNDDLRQQVELLTQRMDAVHMHHHDDDATVTDENPFGSPRLRSPERPNPNNRWEQGFKVESPQFDGSLKPDDFIDWLSQDEEILDFKDVPAERSVSLVTICLHGRAQAWWQQLKQTRVRHGKEKADQKRRGVDFYMGDSSSDYDDAVPDSRPNLLYPGGNDAVQFSEVFYAENDTPEVASLDFDKALVFFDWKRRAEFNS